MATGVHSPLDADLNEHMVEVSEFGLLDTILFEPENPDRIYHGRVYSLTPEAAKELSDITGFAANFEHPGVRTANLDVFDGQGFILWEIDRNTKPQDVAVRYSRDRWELQEVVSKIGDKLRSAIRTEYRARTLDQEMLEALCRHLLIAASDLDKFFVRLDFRGRKYSLITEKEHLLLFPTGWHYSFLVPKPKEEAAAEEQATGETAADEPAPERATADAGPAARESSPVVPRPPAASPPSASMSPANKTSASTPAGSQKMESQVKYATYSRSETEALVKQHVEALSNQLGAKVSQLQRTIQEAHAEQQKGFGKSQEQAVREFQLAASRLDTDTKAFSAAVTSELDAFKKALSKELDQHRNQINKVVLPVAKALEDKPEKLATPTKGKSEKAQPAAQAPARDPLMLGLLVGLLLAVVISASLSISKLGEIDELKAKVSELSSKLESK